MSDVASSPAIAIVAARGARDAVRRARLDHAKLAVTRGWLERHVRTIAAVLLMAVAIALMRNGITGLTD
jgi:hypothetical protein